MLNRFSDSFSPHPLAVSWLAHTKGDSHDVGFRFGLKNLNSSPDLFYLVEGNSFFQLN